MPRAKKTATTKPKASKKATKVATKAATKAAEVDAKAATKAADKAAAPAGPTLGAAFAELDLHPGDPIWVSLKATEVVVYTA